MSDNTESREPFLLWWMPVVAFAAPLLLAAWEGATADADAVTDAVVAFFWPGVLLYFGALAVLWAGWKIDLE